jgi:membrane protease YdiL (CAAX protease family)
MTLFDDNPFKSPDQNPEPHLSGEAPFESPSQAPLAHSLAGDPISYAALGTPVPNAAPPTLPEDLRISWSWPHLLVFIVFFFASQLAIGLVALAYYSTNRHLSQSQLRKFLETDPKFLVGTTILWSALMLLFLYVTLAVLRDLPFWSSLGWKKFSANPADQKGRPWMYFLSGCGLSLFVAVASSRVKDADHTPIQELFKNPTGAMLLMAMAVFVAPLVEETLFRGYLYPVLARIFSSVAQFLGMESPSALRIGVGSSILVTGVLFGLLHAPQLGWTLGLVTLLTFLGVIFTFVRAWTGTVLASFLLHLGYNSFIAVTSIVVTKGFTHLPPHP